MESMKDMPLWIRDIAPSFQGEGLYTGVPIIILRLMVCNLKCSSADGGFDCDTSDTWKKGHLAKGEKLTPLEIVERVKSVTSSEYVVMLTGGEPLIWQNNEEFKTMLELLREASYVIHVETNGTQELTEHTKKYISFFSISPKQTQYKYMYNKRVVDSYKELPHQWKYVIRTQENIDDAITWLEKYDINSNDLVYLMPEGITKEIIDFHTDSLINPSLITFYSHGFLNIGITGRDQIAGGYK